MAFWTFTFGFSHLDRWETNASHGVVHCFKIVLKHSGFVIFTLLYCVFCRKIGCVLALMLLWKKCNYSLFQTNAKCCMLRHWYFQWGIITACRNVLWCLLCVSQWPGPFCFICTVWFGEIWCNWNDTNWGSVSTWERQTSWLVFSQTGLPDSRCWFCCSMAKRDWRTDSMRGRALLWGTWLCPFITAGKAGSWRNPRVQISCLTDPMSCENNAA